MHEQARRDCEAATGTAENALKALDGLKNDLQSQIKKTHEAEMRAGDLQRVCSTQEAQIQSMTSAMAALQFRCDDASGKANRAASLLEEREAELESFRAKDSEQQALISRQEHDLFTMKAQYEAHMEKIVALQTQMQTQRQDLERIKHTRFYPADVTAHAHAHEHAHAPPQAVAVHAEEEYVIPNSGGNVGEGLHLVGLQHKLRSKEEQIASLKSELERRVQRERALLSHIKDTEQKFQGVEQSLGNIDKVVHRLNKNQ